MARLLKEKYKTWEGADKRCRFENGIALGEYQRGDMAHHYRYTVVADEYYKNPQVWRIKRELANA